MNDLISRQAAIDAIEHRLAEPTYQHTGEDWYVGMNCAESEIYELPSTEPERKKGQWIGKEQFANSPEFYSWQCSVCGCVLEDPTLDKPYPFCPICGSHNAEEEGEQE